jgi:hypothetical protein
MKIRSKENHRIGNFRPGREEQERMTLVLRGEEFVTTEALSASTLARLTDLARRRPIVINGVELHRQDLAELAKQAERTGQPVWPRLSCPRNAVSLS